MTPDAVEQPDYSPFPRGAVTPPSCPLEANYAVREGRIVIEMSTKAAHGCLAVWFLLVLALAGWLTYIFIDSQGRAWTAMLIFGAGGGLMLLFFLFMLLPTRTTVELDQGKLSVTIRGGGQARKHTELTPAQIESIVVNKKAILVKHADSLIALGHELSPEERDWIYMILRRVFALESRL